MITAIESLGELTEVEKRKFDAFVKESDQIVAGIRSIQETQRRMITLIPPVLAVGIPLLLRPAVETPKELVTVLFLGFGYMFLLFVANYIGLTRGILRLSKYQLEYLTPKINNLLQTNSSEVFYWEEYLKQKIRKPIRELFGFTLIQSAEFLLLASPSVVCFGLGVYYALLLEWNLAIGLCLLIYLSLVFIVMYFALLTLQESR
jgi:hypothetical protein